MLQRIALALNRLIILFYLTACTCKSSCCTAGFNKSIRPSAIASFPDGVSTTASAAILHASCDSSIKSRETSRTEKSEQPRLLVLLTSLLCMEKYIFINKKKDG